MFLLILVSWLFPNAVFPCEGKVQALGWDQDCLQVTLSDSGPLCPQVFFAQPCWEAKCTTGSHPQVVQGFWTLLAASQAKGRRVVVASQPARGPFVHYVEVGTDLAVTASSARGSRPLRATARGQVQSVKVTGYGPNSREATAHIGGKEGQTFRVIVTDQSVFAGMVGMLTLAWVSGQEVVALLEYPEDGKASPIAHSVQIAGK